MLRCIPDTKESSKEEEKEEGDVEEE